MWISFYGRSVWKYFIDDREVAFLVGNYKSNGSQIESWSGHVIHDSRKPNDGFKPVMIKSENLSVAKLKVLIAAKEYGYKVKKVLC